MIDRQEPDPNRSNELGRAAKTRMLDAAKDSGFFDSRCSYPLTYQEVEVREGEFVYLPATLLTFDGIMNIVHSRATKGAIPRAVTTIEIPIAEYQEFEPLVKTVVDKEFVTTIVRKVEDDAVRIGTASAVRSRLDRGNFQKPERIEGFRTRVHSAIDQVSTRRSYSPERTSELRGIVDQGIAEALEPTPPPVAE